MGGVTISPNLKKTSVRINPNGDIIDPKTKQIITPAEREYVPPIQVEKKPEPVAEAPKSNPLAEAIKAQVQAQVQKTLKEIDVAAMVKQAIEEAFK